MAETARIKVLADRPPREGGRYVQYWMQQAMRAEGNAALDHAIEIANGLKLPVLVSFGLTGRGSPPYPDANARHYTFLLEGLAEVAATLERRGIAFAIRYGAPDEVTLALARHAAVLVCDRGYLKPQRAWRAAVEKRIECRFVEVETDAVVPLEQASTKHEFAARTLRPKIMRLWDEYLADHRSPPLRHKAGDLGLRSDVDLADVAKVVSGLRIDHEVGPVARFRGGLKAARRNLRSFLADGFDGYRESRSEPSRATVSHLSPYLHFGQISPVEIALAAREAKGGRADRDSFLEELIVRRELAQNHVWFAEDYDSYACLPDWARTTLDQHREDKRPHLYHPPAARGRRDPRPLLERRAARDARDRLHAQPAADVLGQEDPGMVGDARARLRDDPRHQQPLLRRRPRREFLHERRLALRAARPALVPPPGLRHGALSRRRHAEEVRRRGLRPVRGGALRGGRLRPGGGVGAPARRDRRRCPGTAAGHRGWQVAAGRTRTCPHLLPLGLLAALAAPAAASPLAETPRRVLVFAPDPADSRLAEQRRRYEARRAGAAERDLEWVEAVGPAPAAEALRRRFGVGPGEFRVILVGRDRGAKLSSGEPVAAERLFAEIDAMPMRREEMRRREPTRP